MKLTIISRIKSLDYSHFGDYFTQIEEFEVVQIRWLANHQLEFIRKSMSHYEHLKDNQEILRLTD